MASMLDTPHSAVADGRGLQRGPDLFGMSIKQVSLITLTFQNSALILLLHYSRLMTPSGDHRYFTSTAVFLTEVIKLAISLTFALYEVSRTLAPQTPATVIFEQIYNSVFSGDGWKLAITATLYTLQNTLQYVSLSNLDPVHFQVLYQLRILTSAFFSVSLLSRTLGIKRWISLFILTIGVSLVSLPSGDMLSDPARAIMMVHDTSDHWFPRSIHELGQITGSLGDVAHELTRRGVHEAVDGIQSQFSRRSASYEGIQEDQLAGVLKMNYSIGLISAVVAAAASGLAGVCFEKVLKDSTTPGVVSVWTRNIQLSFYSLFPALLVGIFFMDGAEIARHGFFDGYNWVVWTLILFQAVGGILTSLVIHYADNIAKNFATSISIVASFLVSEAFFNLHVSVKFLLGTALVMFSTYLYSIPERKLTRPPPINIVSYEKTTVDSTPVFTPTGGLGADKMNLDPLESVKAAGRSSSRPSSPMFHPRPSSSTRGRRFDD